MPRNTTVEEQVALINRLGCIHAAMRAEFELSRQRKAEASKDSKDDKATKKDA